MLTRGKTLVLTWRVVLAALAVPLPGWAASEVVALRLIPDEPREVLDPRAVSEAVEVTRWPLRSPADLKGWTLVDAAATEGDGGLELRVTGPHPRLERSVNLDAGAVDGFHFEWAARRDAEIELLWKRSGEWDWANANAPATRDRVRPVDSKTAQRALSSGHEIAVAPIAQWSGRVARLRFRLLIPRGKQTSLAAIVAVRYRPNAQRWEEAARKPWRVSLSGENIGDMRSALLAPRQQPIVRSIPGLAKARLQFDYGVHGRPQDQLCFTVRAAPASGETLDLFSRCLEAKVTDHWFSASADLAPLAGREAQLLFEVTGDAGAALPLWGNPEVVAQADDEPPNIVLISIDTLRADRLGMYGHYRPTSPHLDRWARERAITFEQAIASANWTVPSHVSMLSGLSALKHGVNYDRAAPAEILTLAEILRARGYTTLALTGGGFLAPSTGLDQGFDRYAHWRTGWNGAVELATDIDVARGWLKEIGKRRFFLFFHTYEVHRPYLPREPFFSRFNDSGLQPPPGQPWGDDVKPTAEGGFVHEKRVVWKEGSEQRPADNAPLPPEALALFGALYDSGVAYMDQEIMRLLQELRDLGLERTTMVILTSDHGEALGENGLAGHFYLFDFNLHVPLLVALPNSEHAGKRVAAQVQSIDLVPTVLDVLGIPVPNSVEGTSLLPLLSADPPDVRKAWSYAANSNHGIALRLDGGLKYVFNNSAWPAVNGREQLLRIDDKTRDEREAPDDTAKRLQLRRDVANQYATNGPPALRVTVVNNLSTELLGHIGAPALGPTQVKSVAPVPGALRYDKGVEFTVPAGRRLELFLEGILKGTLSVSLDAQTSPGQSHVRERLELEQLTQSLALELQAEKSPGWSRDSLAAGATGIEVAWRGRKPQKRDNQIPMTSEVREQLRALGYIE